MQNTTHERHLIFQTLGDNDEVRRVVHTLVMGLPQGIKGKVSSILEHFILKVVKEFHSLQYYNSQIQYYESCKRNSERFIQISQRIIDHMMTSSEIHVTLDHHNNFSKVLCDDQVIYQWDEFYPRVYKVIVNALKYINNCESHEEVLSLLHVLISISECYKDIRYHSTYAIKREEDRIFNSVFVSEESANHARLTYYSEFRDDFLEFMEDFMTNNLNCHNSSVDQLMSNVRKSIRKVLSVRDIKNLNCPNYVSLASSGMRDVRNKSTIPAVFADIYEKIPRNIADLPVYGNNLMKDPSYFKVKEGLTGIDYGKFVTIPQSKLKRRGIHVSPNYLNDRLSYYHSLTSSILRGIDQDCTFDQRKGYETVRQFTEHPEYQLFSLDLTAATDTWLIEHQADVLECILKPYNGYNSEIVKTWKILMTHPEYYKGELHTMFVGQPQGRLSSFPVFALTHHMLMLYVLYKLYGHKEIPLQYMILGDDSFVAIEEDWRQSDGIHPFAREYQRTLSHVNVECNLDKGYQSMGANLRIAEFAKVLSIGGYVVTSAPWNLLSSAEPINYWAWWLTYSPWESIDNISRELSIQLGTNEYYCSIYLALECDYSRFNGGLPRLFLDRYDETIFKKYLYLKDRWLLANSILLNLLNEKAKEDLPITMDYHFIMKQIIREERRYKEYLNLDSPKLVNMLDIELMKNFIRDGLGNSIDLSTIDRKYLEACLSCLRVTESDILIALEDVLNTLKYGDGYERSLYFRKVINSLRGRSFKTEMLSDPKWFLNQIKDLVEELSEGDETPKDNSEIDLNGLDLLDLTSINWY